MKCPACDRHTTSFINLVYEERRLYTMPFVRTCPLCRAKIRLGVMPLTFLICLVAFLHSGIEVGSWIATRYGFQKDHAVISTILIFAVPFFLLLYLLWKHGRYTLR